MDCTIPDPGLSDIAELRTPAVLERISDGFIALDPEQCVLYCNGRAEAIFGRPRSEVLGQNLFSIFPEAREASLDLTFREAFETQTPVDTTWTFPMLGVWLTARVFPYPSGLAVYFRDISPRKRAEEGLRETQDRLRFMLETAEVGDWDLDLQTHQAARSLRHDQIFGYQALLPEWSYEIFLDHVHPEDRAAVDGAFRRALAEHDVWDFETRIIRGDGAIRWIWARGGIRRDSQGTPVRAMGLVRDITEYKQGQEEREMLLSREREAKERSEFLADASQLLGSSLDFEPTLTRVAGLALPYLGSWCFVDLVEPDGSIRRVAVIHPEPTKQVLARRLEQGWPPERDDPVGAPRVVRTGQSEVIAHVTDEMLVAAAHSEENLRILRELGIGSLVIVPLIARDQVLGAITFVSAQTGQQYTDDDIGLAEGFATRAAMAIDNARLFQATVAARAEAEEANRAKSLFLTTMSHELRTPLNAIAGYAELLEMGIAGMVSDGQREQVARIQANQRHLLGLVNSVLDYAKIDAGRMEYQLERLRIGSVLDEVETIVAPLATRKGITYPAECPGATLEVRADREKLEQILINLLTNAIKFTDGGGEITIRCESDGDRVAIRVQDTGIGIAPDHLETIFEPFIQVQEGLTRTEQGTGLGLAISRNLARGMGGDLRVESTPGVGSMFTLTLPDAFQGNIQYQE